ncbi:hypothetical protein QN277_024769 [Acacia crassicarpa]|nr:hypothetical protein QN277_024755 [Acacia crassicarpa]KAK4268056.1 hypothetical protein QN277_024761 [Acacia crassicarpa]KAK4268060.1 hypothetical protein QN277_024765 [Acacia crassicarpa]KAK4268064.1 hypothetical protein QN277_024769 [Acacia crassicarpa]
MNGCSAV